MPGFTDSFWSADYAGGLGVLFGKLQQGVQENQQILTIATMRAEAEELYGDRLGDIAPAVDKLSGGFARDDGASVRKAYEGVRGGMLEASKNHQKIAANIRELVINPFSRWCEAHALRVQNSQDDLQSKVKAYDKQSELVKKLRAQYFNKCRLVEDSEEENKLAFQAPEKAPTSPKQTPIPTINLPDQHEPEESEEEEAEPVELGDKFYTPDQTKRMFTHMLEVIPMTETRVPILGTYQNVSLGSDITEYIQKHLMASSVSYAERIGQDMVNQGYLRLVGNVGSTFANSSRMYYQWRPKVFQISGVPEKKKPLNRVGSGASDSFSLDSPMIGSVNEILSTWNPLNNPHPNETPAEKLKREARESDEKYKAAVKRLDLLRCNLEESIMDHLKFLERCETDRLKAIQSVVLDFSGAISNVIPALRSQVDNMMLYHETIQPLGDLRYMLENYRTGSFTPKVTPYENYYGSVDEQTFGVDLEARARADRKRVPIIVTTILTYLDNHYPDLEGDEARRSIWLVDVPLAATHHLRSAINNGKAIPREILERYEIPIVASVLKLYLLELPDSIVSSQVYEIIKTIYATTDPTNSLPDARIKILQSTLGQLRLNNIATLDALTTHFTRLMDLTSADEAYVTSLAQTLAPCVLRPRSENSLTLNERHAYRLIRDLFDHKESIFGELKRQSSTLGGGQLPNSSARPRAVSTADESNRRANMEARARAISERARDKSPQPTNRHRRDHSTDGRRESGGRFPVVASPTSSTTPGAARAVGPNRGSLEVPGSLEGSPVTEKTTPDSAPTSPPQGPVTNGVSKMEDQAPRMSATGGPGPHIPPPADDSSSNASPVATDVEKEKPGSLKRSSAGSGGARLGRRPGHKQGSVGSLGSLSRRNNTNADSSSTSAANGEDSIESHPGRQRGITLEDKPMDD